MSARQRLLIVLSAIALVALGCLLWARFGIIIFVRGFGGWICG